MKYLVSLKFFVLNDWNNAISVIGFKVTKKSNLPLDPESK